MILQKIVYMIMAQDMKRAIRFYNKLFGMHVRFESAEWSELSWEGSTVALHGGGNGKANPTGLSFQVQDIYTACERVTLNGGTVVHPPEDRPGEPILLAEIKDTEGNMIVFTQNK